jgi:V8-like Glu-specific endopeptidase
MRRRDMQQTAARNAGSGDQPAAAPAARAAGTSAARGSLVSRLLPWLVCVTVIALGGYVMTPLASAAPLPPAQHGVPFDGTAAVGALFTISDGTLGRHFCTASVVDSPAENLLITAAHCMTGKALGDVAFAPGYYDGHFPHGVWIVRKLYVDAAWEQDHNPNDDFAFLIAGRPGTHIQRHTGAERLEIFQPPQVVTVLGYPDRSNRPITCTNRAHSFSHGRQMVFDCDSYTDGTSGGPFLIHVKARTGDGWVIGVIGGYQQGGDTPDVSYSPRFFTSIRRLYRIATAPSPALGSG